MKIHSLTMMAGLLIVGSVNAAPIQWSDNGHYYEYVSDSTTWNEALSLAATSYYNGMQGYLATITSQGEQDFLRQNFPYVAWIAGSDEWDPASENDEGVWKWMAGPETGQQINFFAWASGEPNNCCGGEDYLQFHWVNDGGWNDHGGPGNASQRNGYLVEYSPNTPHNIPEPTTLILLGSGLAAIGWRRRKAS